MKTSRPHLIQKACLCLLGFFLLDLLVLKTAALASDEQIPYLARLPLRVVRGASNVALGWTEPFLRPFGERKSETVSEAMVLGASHTVVRLFGGITDITTCWVPDIQMNEIYPDWQTWPYLFHWS